MFESSLLELFQSDPELVALVSTDGEGEYKQPSIFSDLAPEEVDLPYIVFKIDRYPSDHLSVDRFFINVDYYGRGSSYEDARKASERVELLTDTKELTHSRYTHIRMYRASAGTVPEDDPREIHYNTQITARACRKSFIDNL